MCGIVGYVGKNQAKDILMTGLEKLEYRGYDSAGVAVCENGSINIAKVKGRISDLREYSKNILLEGSIGIGHTRWATHGEPSKVNSHPHFNKEKSIAVVHNGIIENYETLRRNLTQKGYEFISQTDTEVLPHLIDYYYKGDLLDAVISASKKLEGSFAFCVICICEPDRIVAVRKDSPLIIGVGNDENFIASDVPAILSKTRNVYFVDDMEFAVVKKDSVEIFDAQKTKVEHKLHTVTFDAQAAEKGGYEHFMLKEIHEQATAVRDTVCGRLNNDMTVSLGEFTYDDLKGVNRISIVACGTAYHAGLVGKYLIERLARIPVFIELASEFRYNNPIIDEKTLVVVISQSGETADTLAALRLAKRKGAKVLAITNVVGSTVSREADFVFYTYAGPEIAVASTKAYTSQLAAMYIFALFLADMTKTTSDCELNEIKKELIALPEKVEKVFGESDFIKSLAKKICNENDVFYLGRGLDYAVAMEGSLKLKEISYIHSETYAGGELKHGPIALIDEGTVVIAISTSANLASKMDSNIKEVKARGAYVLGVFPDGFKGFSGSFDDVLYIPTANELLYPILSVIPLQLLAYYVAVEKNCDVDKPRNLAKSVTVE